MGKLTITLFQFSKKYNSTKRPDMSSGIEVSGEINEPFNVLSPAFLISSENMGLTDSTVPGFNYLFIEDFHKYYFIEQWIFDSGLWIASAKEDVLATFKTQIGSSTCFIVRAASEWNKNIADTQTVTTAEQENLCTTLNWHWSDQYHTGGAYVVGVLNDQGNTMGALTYYCLDATAFSSLMGQLLSNVNTLNIDAAEISKELQKALFNPSSYLISAMWFPADLADYVGEAVGSLRIGWWNWSVGGKKRIINPAPNSISGADAQLTATVEQVMPIPKHPQAAAKGPWLNNEPYTAYSLECIPFGVFKINSSQLLNSSYLHIIVQYDYLTGKGILRVTADNNPANIIPDSGSVLNAETQFGVPVPLGQIAVNLNTGAAPAIAAASEALTHLPNFSLPAAASSNTGTGATAAGSLIDKGLGKLTR